MNPESQITEAQRQLLGADAADELTRDERWFSERIGVPELPAAVRQRLSAAIRNELSAAARRQPRQTLRHDWRIAAAAIVLFGLLVGLFAKFILQRPIGRPPQVAVVPTEARVAAAQRAVDTYVGTVDSYLKAVDKDQVQVKMKAELTEMARIECDVKRTPEVGSPGGPDNPWQAVASVIESGHP